MAENAENEEKIFEHYLQLASNVRMKIIDKMDPNDRCRLTRCSKRCNKEGKASRKYIYELGVRFWPDFLKILVIHGKYEDEIDIQNGFMLKFVKISEQKFMKYERFNSQVLWMIELDSSTNLVQYGLEIFKDCLNLHQDTIKNLEISEMWVSDHGIKLEDVDLKIKSLKNLESLSLKGPFDIHQIFSKLQHPLKNVSVSRQANLKLIHYEQIYQVQDSLSVWGVEFDNQQFLSLSAKKIEINIGKLTEKDVFKFIRSWQNGTIGKEIRSCSWYFGGSNFDRRKFLRLLRYSNPDATEDLQIEIKHYKKVGKSAKLNYSNWELKFFI